MMHKQYTIPRHMIETDDTYIIVLCMIDEHTENKKKQNNIGKVQL
jgi:hypothetical protein